MAHPTTRGRLARKQSQRGFGYLVVLLIAVVLGIASSITYEQQETLARREREQQWLFVGLQYKQAIKQYYDQSPDGIKQLPQELKELLKDTRFVSVRRYLRKAYADPITNQDWQLVFDEDSRIIGVVSTSDLPILQMGQVLDKVKLETSEEKPSTYAQVKFVLEKADLTDETNNTNNPNNTEEGEVQTPQSQNQE